MKRSFRKIKSYKDPVKIFDMVINNLIVKDSQDTYYGHSQMTNLVFGKGDSINQSYMSIVTNHFGNYMIRNKNRYKFDIELIKEHYPQFFQIAPLKANVLSEIRTAIKHEINASYRKRVGRIIYVSEFTFLGDKDQFYFYDFILNLESEDILKLYEGMNIKLAIDKRKITVTVLDFIDSEAKLTIRSVLDLTDILNSSKKIRLITDTIWLLNKLQESLDNYPINKLPISKLLKSNWTPKIVDEDPDFYKGLLDASQCNALLKSLRQDISAIWGPPGTGKSTTVSYLLLDLFRKKERTLVCSIANAAVDSILKLTLDTFLHFVRDKETGKPLDYYGGKIVRVGYSKDIELNNIDYIKVDSPLTRRFNYRLREIKNKLRNKNLSSIEKAELKSEQLDLIEKLEFQKKQIIYKASIVFATASKCEIDKAIKSLEFDNLIIDEASMMSAPHLLALGKLVNKRIIIAGDFRQLGPIAISQSSAAYNWLHKDLFEFYGINPDVDLIEHHSLSMITNQRRFHESICTLINGPFYQFKLVTKTENTYLKLYKRDPVKQSTIIYYDISNLESSIVMRTKEQSRYNPGSLEFVLTNIIKPLIRHSLKTPFSIAIITPYRGQVNQYRIELPKRFKDEDFLSRIKFGTVHSFQGSQADLVIFDMVETDSEKIGRLYWQKSGKRMINVAISRATGKLIFVGNIKAITEGMGYMNVNQSVKLVLKQIEKHKY